MITPMRHVFLVCRSADAGDLLEHLREFGALHLHLRQQDNHHIEDTVRRLRLARQAVIKLSQLPAAAHTGTAVDPAQLVMNCQTAQEKLKRLQEIRQKLQQEAKVWAPFGSVEPSTLVALRQGGLLVSFHRLAAPPPDFPASAAWLSAAPGFGLCVRADAPPEEEDPSRLPMPVRGHARIQGLLTRLDRLRVRLEAELSEAARALPELQTYAAALEDELNFRRAQADLLADDESLGWVEGFVPEDQMTALEPLAARWGAALSSREPAEGDHTPTLLHQNAFVSWIQPVFNFLGVTPGYREVDVGWSFLIFLSIFSGMIIGDAGYGLLLMFGVLGLNLWKPASRGKFANLLFLMGGTTTVWGLLTGNIFGIANLPPALAALRIDSLADVSNPKPVMQVCFVMGAVHLSLAHGWNLLRNLRTPRALAELGWIGSTWTMYAVSGLMVLGWESLPGFVLPMFGVSVLLIVLFMTPPAEFKGKWVDHMMLPLSFVNNFVDVVSYVRLYAVGMATFALATSFNSMILDGMGERNWLANGLMLVILVLGHALNFILAGMGVMVHGIRLNTLEFASHMGLTWSGIPYTPFRKHGPETAP